MLAFVLNLQENVYSRIVNHSVAAVVKMARGREDVIRIVLSTGGGGVSLNI